MENVQTLNKYSTHINEYRSLRLQTLLYFLHLHFIKLNLTSQFNNFSLENKILRKRENILYEETILKALHYEKYSFRSFRIEFKKFYSFNYIYINSLFTFFFYFSLLVSSIVKQIFENCIDRK